MLRWLISKSRWATVFAVPAVGVAMVVLGTNQPPLPSSLRTHLQRLDARTGGPLSDILGTPGRLTVLYWPALGQCAAVEPGLIGALEHFEARFPDTRVVSVIPAGWPEASRYGRPLPGRVLALDKADYQAQTAETPLPRVEVWNAEQGLLLYRALSRVGAEVDYLTTELERARSLTQPESAPTLATLGTGGSR